MSFFVPPRQFWVEEVKNLIFPLWNPYYFNGHPLFATLQPGVFYPLSILYLFLPFNWAFNLNIELHFALAGIFTYLLLRGMKASQGAGIISAVGFMLSGYLVSVHSLLSTLFSVTWMPLFFLCYFSALKNNRTGHAVLSGLIGTVMFLGGGVEVCYLTFAIAFFLTLFPELVLGLNDFIKLRRRLFLFVIFGAVFFGLSAIQLLPFLELSQLSIRSIGLTYEKAGIWSLHPYNLIEFFLPDQYGRATDINAYWAHQHWLKTIYMGGTPFILGALFLRKWDRLAQGLLLLFCISLGLAMGNNTLFHHFLYEHLPLFNKLRYPVKFIFLAVLVLSVAAGLGYDYFKNELAENNSQSQRWARYILSLGFFCMIVFGVLTFFNEPIVAYFKGIGWDQPIYQEPQINIFNFKRFIVFTSLFCLGLFLLSKPKFQKPFFGGALITLFVLDLFFSNFGYYKKAKLEDIHKKAENAKFLQSDPGLFRIYVTSESKSVKFLSAKFLNSYEMQKELLTLGRLANQRIFNVGGGGVTIQLRWKKMADLIASVPEVDRTNLINMMNVKYVLSIPPITSHGFDLVHNYDFMKKERQEIKEPVDSSTIKIYENKNVLPHAFLVPQCRVINSELEYKETLESKNFDPEKVVLLDGEPKNLPCNEKRVSQKEEPVKVDSYKSNTVDLTVNSKSRQFLFLSDSYYPGWKAYVDDEKTEVLRANFLFRAIVIEPGKHHVRFEYDPLSFKLGLLITALTILLCCFYFFRRNANCRNFS